LAKEKRAFLRSAYES